MWEDAVAFDPDRMEAQAQRARHRYQFPTFGAWRDAARAADDRAISLCADAPLRRWLDRRPGSLALRQPQSPSPPAQRIQIDPAPDAAQKHGMKESDLYPPVKAYLEAQGYDVKAEIGDCDVMAIRGEEPPVVVELKLTFSLALVMQGVARQRIVDDVYLAVPVSGERGWKLRYKDIIRLCRRLGLGLLAVRDGGVEAHLDPGDYQPRKQKRRIGRLLKEFERRVGDPNDGGTTGVTRMTAYRQDALRCAMHLDAAGPTKAAAIAAATGVARAATIMRADHYGWFERVERGTYALTPKGVGGLEAHAEMVAALSVAEE